MNSLACKFIKEGTKAHNDNKQHTIKAEQTAEQIYRARKIENKSSGHHLLGHKIKGELVLRTLLKPKVLLHLELREPRRSTGVPSDLATADSFPSKWPCNQPSQWVKPFFFWDLGIFPGLQPPGGESINYILPPLRLLDVRQFLFFQIYRVHPLVNMNVIKSQNTEY